MYPIALKKSAFASKILPCGSNSIYARFLLSAETMSLS
ncbi:Uncharacterised protein [Vibrio cholerae]|nr:Uncharacterised protein [Vibrio cholerae]